MDCWRDFDISTSNNPAKRAFNLRFHRYRQIRLIWCTRPLYTSSSLETSGKPIWMQSYGFFVTEKNFNGLNECDICVIYCQYTGPSSEQATSIYRLYGSHGKLRRGRRSQLAGPPEDLNSPRSSRIRRVSLQGKTSSGLADLGGHTAGHSQNPENDVSQPIQSIYALMS